MPHKPPYKSAATYYFNKGINTLPLVPRAKKPALKWKHLSDKLMTPQTLAYYKNFYPNHNIGIVTGSVSGLVVVDVDGIEGAESLAEYMMPDTLRCDTKRGYHLYYKIPPLTKIPSTISLLPKVDIKAEGGYVVAPPSVSHDGTIYKWNMSPSALKDLPFVPDWIIQKIRLREQGVLPKGKKAVARHAQRKLFLEDILNGVGEGKRNQACAQYAGMLVSKGYDEETCIKELLEWNLKNLPPLPDREVMECFQSIFNRDKMKHYDKIRPISLESAKKKVAKYLRFEDDDILDVVLAVARSYDFDAGPVWMLVVAPPSSGKTEVLRSLKGFVDTIFIESITSRTLFTGMRGARGIMERHTKPHMLMINKDFGSILAKGSAEKSLILQQLRGLFDQEYYDETGGGKGTIEWNNRLNFLGAATQDIESRENQKVLGDLGERFLYFKMKAETDDSIRAKALQAMTRPGGDKRMRTEVAEAMLGVLRKYEDLNDGDINISETIMEWLIELCMIAVKLRTRVKRDGYKSDVIEYKPAPEGVMRMLKSVKALLLGIAMIRGHKETQVKDYGLAARVVVDSVPSYRKDMLKFMYFKDKWLTAGEVAKEANINKNTSRLTLEDLAVVGLLEKDGKQVEFGAAKTTVEAVAYRIKPSVKESIKKSGMEGLL